MLPSWEEYRRDAIKRMAELIVQRGSLHEAQIPWVVKYATDEEWAHFVALDPSLKGKR